MERFENSLGANLLGDGRCHFLVWAPKVQNVEVHIQSPQEKLFPLRPTGQGYFEGYLDNVSPGTVYKYRLNSQDEYPDPASHYQPEGVFGPSQVMAQTFRWEDALWRGIPLQEYIIYELHTGTYTSEGTFEAIISYLDSLVDLGITAIELMPIAQFPGHRNWGYDGVYPFAPQNTYGGVSGLKKLVNACHKRGMAVILDVVYNHMGPEGSFIDKFGPYYSEWYKTGWGKAINFDGPGSDEVRRFFIENALYWITDFHIDALRLDAVHTMLDFSSQTFLEDLVMAVKHRSDKLSYRAFIIAESDSNNPRLIRPPSLGGYGLDAQWSDDFHHALHVLLTGEQAGYYQDFNHLRYLVAALEEGFAYTGEYSSYRGCRRGSVARDVPSYRFVVFSQNHDQIGNRMLGERLSHLVSFESLKLAAGITLFSPCIPLLFMGEEYGETAHFPYFVSHSDPKLVEAVRQGRKTEFAAFHGGGEPPDPQREKTFLNAKLDHHLREEEPYRTLLAYYQTLIRLRKEIPALGAYAENHPDVLGYARQSLIFLHRCESDSEIIAGFNFSDSVASAVFPAPDGEWQKQIDSSEKRWKGSGSSIPERIFSEGEISLALNPKSLVLFSRPAEDK